MGRLKTRLEQNEVENLGVWQASTMEGYNDEMANNDIQLVYLKGQLRATESIHASFGNNSTKRRIEALKKDIEALREEQK